MNSTKFNERLMEEARQRRIRILKLRRKSKKMREIAKLWKISKARVADICQAGLDDLKSGRITEEEIGGSK